MIIPDCRTCAKLPAVVTVLAADKRYRVPLCFWCMLNDEEPDPRWLDLSGDTGIPVRVPERK